MESFPSTGILPLEKETLFFLSDSCIRTDEMMPVFQVVETGDDVDEELNALSQSISAQLDHDEMNPSFFKCAEALSPPPNSDRFSIGLQTDLNMEDIDTTDDMFTKAACDQYGDIDCDWIDSVANKLDNSACDHDLYNSVVDDELTVAITLADADIVQPPVIERSENVASKKKRGQPKMKRKARISKVSNEVHIPACDNDTIVPSGRLEPISKEVCSRKPLKTFNAGQKQEGKICEVCGKSFIRSNALASHKWREHQAQSLYNCKTCPYSTTRESLLLTHQRTHGQSDKDSDKEQCPCCDFTYLSSSMVAHLATKHGLDKWGNSLPQQFVCKQCDYRCVTKQLLKTHILRNHTKEKKLKCSKCPYATNEKQSLNKHTKIMHNKERPYACRECVYCFSTASGLKRHQQTHQGVKPYKCTQCDRSYADKKRLCDHILMHADIKPYTCSWCDYTCRRSDNLKGHMSKMHKQS